MTSGSTFRILQLKKNPMTNTVLLGLTVMSVVLLITVPAFADTVLTPLAQYKQGVPVGEVQCRDSKVLMRSPSGMPVCVNQTSVKALWQRGFAEIMTDHRHILKSLNSKLEQGWFAEIKTDDLRSYIDYRIKYKDRAMIEHFNYNYREIDLDYELTDGRMNSYLGVDELEILFLFKNVGLQSTFNVTIPYVLHPPVTSYNIPENLFLNYMINNASHIDDQITVRNQTSTSQTFSFELPPGNSDIILMYNAFTSYGSSTPNLLLVGNFYWNGHGLQHPEPCYGNLIPISRTDGTHLCIQPIMLEYILLGLDDHVDKSVHEKIVRKYEEYACPLDSPVFLVKYDHSSTTCVTHDVAAELLNKGHPERKLWHGDYALSGNQYVLSYG